MAVVPLGIAPILRPWRLAGVTHLLLDEQAQARLQQFQQQPAVLRTRPAPSSASTGSIPPTSPHGIGTASPERQSPSVPYAAPSEAPKASTPDAKALFAPDTNALSAPEIETRPAPQTYAAPEATSPASKARTHDAPDARVQAKTIAPPSPAQGDPIPPSTASSETPDTAITPSSAAVILAPDRWPPYWRELLSRTPPQPKLVWSYPSLSRDLGGDADDAHRLFLRQLLGDMALPKGSHAFWPLNRYPYTEQDEEHGVNASLFASGIETLNPDTVILMTGKAPDGLGLHQARLLMPVLVRGRRFVITPHVDILIKNPPRYTQLMTFLKALLRSA